LFTLTAVFSRQEAQVIQQTLEREDLEGETPAEKLFYIAKGEMDAKS